MYVYMNACLCIHTFGRTLHHARTHTHTQAHTYTHKILLFLASRILAAASSNVVHTAHTHTHTHTHTSTHTHTQTHFFWHREFLQRHPLTWCTLLGGSFDPFAAVTTPVETTVTVAGTVSPFWTLSPKARGSEVLMCSIDDKRSCVCMYMHMYVCYMYVCA